MHRGVRQRMHCFPEAMSPRSNVSAKQCLRATLSPHYIGPRKAMFQRRAVASWRPPSMLLKSNPAFREASGHRPPSLTASRLLFLNLRLRRQFAESRDNSTFIANDVKPISFSLVSCLHPSTLTSYSDWIM